MSEARDKMIDALKAIVVPQLREKGFKGSFPHFRRRGRSRIDLFTFQFDRHGGGFIVELGQCSIEGFVTYWGKQIPPDKVTAWDLPPQNRVRIHARKGSGTDSWFRYDQPSLTDDGFTRIAKSVLPALNELENSFEHFQSDS